jgi:hypothetical protein
MNVAEVSLRQLITPNRWQGRIHASLRVVECGDMFVEALLGGWLGEAIGLQATIATASIGCAAAALPLVLSRSDSSVGIDKRGRIQPTEERTPGSNGCHGQEPAA